MANSPMPSRLVNQDTCGGKAVVSISQLEGTLGLILLISTQGSNLKIPPPISFSAMLSTQTSFAMSDCPGSAQKYFPMRGGKKSLVPAIGTIGRPRVVSNKIALDYRSHHGTFCFCQVGHSRPKRNSLKISHPINSLCDPEKRPQHLYPQAAEHHFGKTKYP